MKTIKTKSKRPSEKKRRYIRLEISSPFGFRVLYPEAKNKSDFFSQVEYSGTILNLSAGGILVASDWPVEEGRMLLLTLNLSNCQLLKGILGKVKRVEKSEENDFLMGIEFCQKEELNHFLSPEQIKFLPCSVTSFNQDLRRVISKCIFALASSPPRQKSKKESKKAKGKEELITCI